MSSYLLYKLFQRSLYQKYEEYSDEDEPDNIIGICRICLKHGTIPIYGERDLSNEIRIFGEIEISDDDGFPKNLCTSCYDMLLTALKFRKTAKQSMYALKNRLCESHSGESHDTFGCSKCSESNDDCLKKSRPFVNTAAPKNVKKKIVRVACRESNPQKKIICQICLKPFTKNYLPTHMLIHDPLSPRFICEVCGKPFKQKCAYVTHRTIHRSEFPFKCNSCAYRGKTSSLLKTHMLTHGAHKFMCTECPARFHTKSNLNKHYWKHRKPEFQCDLCKRAFHVKRQLEKHFKALHLGLKDYVCETCGKGFGYKGALRKHELDVHKREKTKVNGRKPSYLEAEQNSIRENPV